MDQFNTRSYLDQFGLVFFLKVLERNLRFNSPENRPNRSKTGCSVFSEEISLLSAIIMNVSRGVHNLSKVLHLSSDNKNEYIPSPTSVSNDVFSLNYCYNSFTNKAYTHVCRISE